MTWRALTNATLLTVALGAASVVPALPQTAETGFLNRTVLLDGVEYRYQVYVPRDFRRSTSWPVILALHGGAEYGDDGIRQTRLGLATAIRNHPERFPAIAVFPQSHLSPTDGWHSRSGDAALAELDKTIAEFNGDSSRVYLAGHSGGGHGAWYMASRHPERFAALVVTCGYISERRGGTSGIPYPAVAPASASDPYAFVAKQVASLPIWIFHGDADRLISVEESRHMFTALKAIGANVQYTEFPGVDHNAWDRAYDRADLIEWMFKQRRR
jgi:predicted peptidase